jgi:hypothetical protein
MGSISITPNPIEPPPKETFHNIQKNPAESFNLSNGKIHRHNYLIFFE